MAISIKLDKRNIAILDYISMKGNPHYRMITNLNVPKLYRRRGIAHKLLTQLDEVADREHFTLFIYIISPENISKSIITKMLKKHKFELINKYIMCRSNLPDYISKEWLLKVFETHEQE